MCFRLYHRIFVEYAYRVLGNKGNAHNHTRQVMFATRERENKVRSPAFRRSYPEGETYPCRIHDTPTHNERP